MRYFPIFSLRTCPTLVVMFSFLHIGAFLALLFSAATVWIIMPLTAVLGVSSYILLRRYALLSFAHAIVEIRAQNNGAWVLIHKNGQVQEARLCGNSFVTRLGMILNFTCRGNRRSQTALIMPQIVGREIFRQGMVFLETTREK